MTSPIIGQYYESRILKGYKLFTYIVFIFYYILLLAWCSRFFNLLTSGMCESGPRVADSHNPNSIIFDGH